MSLKRFTIFISSMLCIAGCVKLAMACADGPDTYDASSFFFNTINKQPAFVQFYYTPDLAFYTDGYSFGDAGIDNSIPDANEAAWLRVTGNEVTAADIDSFVYKFSAKDVLAIYNHLQKSYTLAVPAVVAQNGFTRWLIKNKDAETALYLAFAKQCEPYTVPLEASWDNTRSEYVTPKRDSAAMQELVHEGIKQSKAATSGELKLRYAYQCIRMALYSREYAQTALLFNTMVTERSDHFLYYRCLSLKAGALYKSGKKSEAAYLYSLAFDKSDEIKNSTYQSFRWAVNGDIAPVLPLCKSDHERAVLYIMQGLYDYSNSAATMVGILENAYRYDPQVRGLEIVATRFINKKEQAAIPGLAGKPAKGDTLLAGINRFAQKAAAEGKAGSRAYWLLSSAYIYLLTGDMASCHQYLDKAGTAKMSDVEQQVHYIITTLYTARRDGRITPATEQELLPMLRRLQEKAGGKEHRYSIVFNDIMLTVLKEAYLAQKDTVRAIYCYSRANGYNSIENGGYPQDPGSSAGQLLEAMPPERLHGVQAFVLSQNKTPFEQWLTEKTPYTAAMLYELEGTKYIRSQRFENAVAVLGKLSAKELQIQLPDALVSHIMDSQDLNASDTLTTYNKLTFAQKMLELQQLTQKEPANGRAAYQYANGLYSMSYYGKAHAAYDYYHGGYNEYAYYNGRERSKLQQYEQEYYNVQLPEHYYMLAFDNSTDREVKARCLFMAAKCRQKSCPVKKDHSAYFGDEKAYYQYSLQSPYFKRLKAEYGNTAFYKQATGTCAYLRDYARKGR